MIPVWLAILIGIITGSVGAFMMSLFAVSGRASECERCAKVLQAPKEAREGRTYRDGLLSEMIGKLGECPSGPAAREWLKAYNVALEATMRTAHSADPLWSESDATERMLQVSTDAAESAKGGEIA